MKGFVERYLSERLGVELSDLVNVVREEDLYNDVFYEKLMSLMDVVYFETQMEVNENEDGRVVIVVTATLGVKGKDNSIREYISQGICGSEEMMEDARVQDIYNEAMRRAIRQAMERIIPQWMLEEIKGILLRGIQRVESEQEEGWGEIEISEQGRTSVKENVDRGKVKEVEVTYSDLIRETKMKFEELSGRLNKVLEELNKMGYKVERIKKDGKTAFRMEERVYRKLLDMVRRGG